jgi:hypothetical protein
VARGIYERGFSFAAVAVRRHAPDDAAGLLRQLLSRKFRQVS